MKSRMKDTLLLVGDANSDRANLNAIFAPHYYILEAENAAQGIMLLQQNSQYIAAVVTDIPLTDTDGLRSLVEACCPSTENEIPVVCLVTPIGTGQREETAFMLGAAEVVHKPYTTLSVQRRVQILVDLYKHQWQLEKLVKEQNETIRNTNQTMVDTLSAIIEYRSAESGNHVLRIRHFTKILLQEIARCCQEYELNEAAVDRISTASALHDIGKISIPDNILNKPGQLTPEEYEIMKTHTTVGGQLTEQIGDIGDPMYLRYIYNICLYHHERWDGRGYPKGLKENEIPICAQVVGLADAYDALTTPRVYKPAFLHETAVNMILNGECGTFSPKLLECFKRVRKEFKALAHKYSDGYSPKSDHIRVPLPAPVQKEYALNALELSQLKYQTVLHHLNDTVIEMDVDNHTYHVIYNPNPDFVSIFNNATFEEMSGRLMQDGAFPEDMGDISKMQQYLDQKLFKQNQRKYSFVCRIFSHLYGEHYPYEITMLRVNTGVPDQRILLVILHNLEDTAAPHVPRTQKHLPDPALLYDLSGGAIRCCMDDALTIEQGAGTLLPLTGFSAADIQEQFSHSLMNMVVPEDRHILNSVIEDHKAQLGRNKCHFRLQRKNSTPVWLLANSRSVIDSDGREICYFLFTDITAGKERQAWLENRVSFHSSLVDLSEGIVLEWNLLEDIVRCSDKWKSRFGYSLPTQNFSQQLKNTSHVHPDDLPQLHTMLNHIRISNQSDFADIRILNIEGRYLWSRIRAQAIRDSSGTPTNVHAIIYDIDELKQDALTMKKQAELDGLTKLMNKASAQHAIAEYLNDRAPDSMDALLILDLDNFKTVNDSLGHLHGDAVLAQVGTTLKNLFRSHDIIGRIGGDEFMILLKDIPNKELVLDRCQLLVDTFRDLFHRLMPKLQVSLSVGAALIPLHGTTFADLFRHADEALYAAKRAGKCQFYLHDSQDTYQAMANAMPHTVIDSDETPSMDNEALIRFVFRQLYESQNIDATINDLLAFIGTHFNVSRVYIFENNEDNTTCSNTFEWCNDGIEPQLDFLQNLNYEKDLPGWKEVYEPTGVLYCSDISELAPHIREIVEPQGIKSMLHCAIMDRGVFRGYVGFDECTANYLWTQGQISLLQFMAEVLAVFLIKQRSIDQKHFEQKNN